MKIKLTAQDWALHIGKKILCDGCEYKLLGVSFSGLNVIDKYSKYDVKFDNCKPILRTLDQMTEDEKQEYVDLFGGVKPNHFYYDGTRNGVVICVIGCCDYFGQFYVASTIILDWLTQKGFDIRNWIEQGLAVKEERND